MEVDDAFRSFFGTTVATDRAAMDEVTGRKRSFSGGLLKKFRAPEEAELTGNWKFQAIWCRPMKRRRFRAEKAAEKAPAASASSADVSPYSKWDSITLDRPKNKIAPQEGTQKVSAAALAQAIAGAQEEDLSRTKSKRRAKIDVTLTGDDFAVPAGEEPEEEWAREDIEEYQNLSDAPAVASNLADMRRTRIIRCAVTGAIALVLLYLGFTVPEGGLPPFRMLTRIHSRCISCWRISCCWQPAR